jgi:hypothetical protein
MLDVDLFVGRTFAIEHPAENMMQERSKPKYDLEERLLDYSVEIIRLVEELPNTRTGNHVANQLLRSGTSPYPNHGERRPLNHRRILYINYASASRN